MHAFTCVHQSFILRQTVTTDVTALKTLAHLKNIAVRATSNSMDQFILVQGVEEGDRDNIHVTCPSTVTSGPIPCQENASHSITC
ncbi:hypothetical protein ANANG_G00157860 [Anguilla anguilla]|uniref:Uncharacterized protein n=1 Tax=Anguilla anguilla TaxID=7936 RepID=A0A9D3M7V0_ANGAN|nr:hypothetical protein ANANG_G00157860 [Anguilla anguilla]